MKKKIIIFSIVAIIGLVCGFKLLASDKQSVKALPVEEEQKTEKKTTKTDTKVKVDIKGAINNPGVYEMDNTLRVIDAINIAGGLREDADTTYLNLSLKLTDEMVIIVYTKAEIADQEQKATVVKYIEKECNCPSIQNDACLYNKNTTTNPDSSNTVNGKININTADVAELQNLNGIGESKAKAIIEYREQNGNFKSIDDLKNVSGIGDTVYNKIKDNITV